MSDTNDTTNTSKLEDARKPRTRGEWRAVVEDVSVYNRLGGLKHMGERWMLANYLLGELRGYRQNTEAERRRLDQDLLGLVFQLLEEYARRTALAEYQRTGARHDRT